MKEKLVLRKVRTEGVPGRKSPDIPEGRVDLYWLGQAGFLIETRGARILIDLYLSDVLAVKYAGAKFPHTRMAPPPIRAGELFDIDLMLSTHSHTDHLDPGTIPLIAENNPGCRFVVPAACRKTAVSRGVPSERLVPARAGEAVKPLEGCTIIPVPAAHEELATNEAGEHLNLGYVIDLNGTLVYHSGDCIPYEGLVPALRSFDIDAALLPVNGRDDARTAEGIIGNFSLEESVGLVLDVPMRFGIGHHYGLFDFNTIDVAEAQAYLDKRSAEIGNRFVLVEDGVRLELAPAERGTVRQ